MTMLKRLYADNFRCFENFEVRFDRSNVLLGRNGTGKTSLLDALRRIQELVVRGRKVDEVFPARDLSVSQRRTTQRFELDTESGGDSYAYRLVVEHQPERNRARVLEEDLRHNDRVVFSFSEGDAQLFHDDYGKGPNVPFDWTQSGVGFLTERPDNQKVTRFKKELRNCIIVGLCPPVMEDESRTEDEFLDPLMRNFTAWYRRAAQENMAAITPLFQALKQALPGFSSINLTESGENTRALKVTLATPAGEAARFGFDQLSDGQRALVALYSLLHLPADRRPSVFLDEPDNYLALSEVQPWLAEAAQGCGESIEQLVLISHHPTTIDYMGGGVRVVVLAG